MLFRLDSGVSKEEKLCLRWRHCWQARGTTQLGLLRAKFQEIKMVSSSLSVCLFACLFVCFRRTSYNLNEIFNFTLAYTDAHIKAPARGRTY